MEEGAVLEGVVDRYGGLIVAAATILRAFGAQSTDTSLTDSVATFRVALEQSVAVWQREARRGIWLHIPVACSALVAVAAECGFRIHHATDAEGIVMTRWLPEESASTVPAYCHTFIGIGGLVTNARGEILVVRERFSIIAAKPYKLPGGLVDAGEELPAAIEREVFEETGIRATFHSLIAVRHAHHVAFDRSDLYFVARLTAAADASLSAPQADPNEIDECRWISPQLYLQDPHVTAFNKYVCTLALQQGPHWKAHPIANWNNTGTQLVYHTAPTTE